MPNIVNIPIERLDFTFHALIVSDSVLRRTEKRITRDKVNRKKRIGRDSKTSSVTYPQFVADERIFQDHFRSPSKFLKIISLDPSESDLRQ